MVNVAAGGSDHISNHAGKCGPCHLVKTQQEAQRGRRKTKREPLKHPGML